MDGVFKRIESFLKVMDKKYKGNCYYIGQYLGTDVVKEIIEYLIKYLSYIIDSSIENDKLFDNFRKTRYLLEFFDFHEGKEDITAIIVPNLEDILEKVVDYGFDTKVSENVIRHLRETLYSLNHKELIKPKIDFMSYLVFERKDYNYVKYVILNYLGLSNVMLGDKNLLEVVMEKYIEELLKTDTDAKNSDALYYERVMKALIFYNSNLVRTKKIKYIIDDRTKHLPKDKRSEIDNHISNILCCFGNLYKPNIILSDGLSEKLKEFSVDRTGRYDLTGLYTVTIDEQKCTYIDDAISAMVLNNGNILFAVSIADVIGNATNDNVNIASIQKLCECDFKISKSIRVMSSLYPLIKKNALTHFFEIDSFGNIVDFKVVKSIIRSSMKLHTEIPFSKTMASGDQDLRSNLLLYKKVLEKIQFKQRNGYGTDEEKTLISIVMCAMITTNSTVGDYFSKNGYPFTFKINKKVEMPKVLNMNNVFNFNQERFAMGLANLEEKWFSTKGNRKYAIFTAKSDYREDYGRVTSPIIEMMSRVLQAIEYIFLVNKDFSKLDCEIIAEYLKSFLVNDKRAMMLRLERNTEIKKYMI